MIDLEHTNAATDHDDRPHGRSLLDEIRGDYERAGEAQTLLLWVPKSRLGVRYRALDPLEMPEVDEDDDESMRLRTVDALIVACSEIVMRDRDGRPITLECDGVPVTFTAELADLMGWQGLKSARDIALRVFSTAPSSKAAAYRHFVELNRWLQGGSESLLGES